MLCITSYPIIIPKKCLVVHVFHSQGHIIGINLCLGVKSKSTSESHNNTKVTSVSTKIGKIFILKDIVFHEHHFRFPPCFNMIHNTQVKLPHCLLIFPFFLLIYYLLSLSTTPCSVLLPIRLYQIVSHPLHHNLTSKALRLANQVLILPMLLYNIIVPLVVLDIY